MYVISENNMFYNKKRGDKYTLIEKKEYKIDYCKRCKAPLKNTDYIYRRKAPNVKTYVCSNCGYSEIYYEE